MKQIVMLIGGESRAAGGGVKDSGWGWFRRVAVAEFMGGEAFAVDAKFALGHHADRPAPLSVLKQFLRWQRGRE
jgi:hypothetical protein